MNDYMLKAWISLDAHARNVVDGLRRRREEGADFLEWLGGMAVVLIVLGVIAAFLNGQGGQGLAQQVVGVVRGLIGKVTQLGKGSGGGDGGGDGGDGGLIFLGF